LDQDLRMIGFKEYDDGFVYSKVFRPSSKSINKDKWEMIVTVSKNQFVNTATFDVINKDGLRVSSDDLYSDGEMNGRGDMINTRLIEICEVLQEWSIPFFLPNEEVVLCDRVKTKVVSIDLTDNYRVGLSPKPESGLVKLGKNEDLADNPTIMFKNKALNYSIAVVFDLRKVV